MAPGDFSGSYFLGARAALFNFQGKTVTYFWFLCYFDV
jgi:hypothetical protein